MNRIVRGLGLVLVMAIGGVGWGHASMAQAASYPNGTCVGALPPGTYNNVTVPTGADCFLGPGDVILGNVTAQAGSYLTTVNATIGGNLLDRQGAGLDVLTFTTIEGNFLVSDMTGNAHVDHAHVMGTALFLNNNGHIDVTSSTAGSNLLALNNTGGMLISGNQIGNVLDCENNNPPPQPQPSAAVNQAQQYGGQCASS